MLRPLGLYGLPCWVSGGGGPGLASVGLQMKGPSGTAQGLRLPSKARGVGSNPGQRATIPLASAKGRKPKTEAVFLTLTLTLTLKAKRGPQPESEGPQRPPAGPVCPSLALSSPGSLRRVGRPSVPWTAFSGPASQAPPRHQAGAWRGLCALGRVTPRPVPTRAPTLPGPLFPAAWVSVCGHVRPRAVGLTGLGPGLCGAVRLSSAQGAPSPALHLPQAASRPLGPRCHGV